MKTKAILFISILLISVNAYNQEPIWENYTSGANINAITEDENYIWIGGAGITQFNKETQEMTFYNTGNSGLLGNEIISMATDTIGNIWALNGIGAIIKFSGAEWTEVIPGDIHSALPPTLIYIDENNNKWIGCINELVFFNDDEFIVYDNTNSNFIGGALCMLMDDSGNLWIGTNSNGLVRYDGDDFISYNTGNSDISGNYISSITIDGVGNIWIGSQYSSWQGVGGVKLSHFDGTNFTEYTTSNSELPGNQITCLTIDENNNLLVGSKAVGYSYPQEFEYFGLSMFNGSNWTHYNKDNSALTDNYITTIFIDSELNKWIGTFYGGLNKLDETNWGHFNTGNSELCNNFINTIYSDQSTIWIGTDNGISKKEDTNWTTYNKYNSDLPENNITSIVASNTGELWFGMANKNTDINDGGLAKFNGSEWSIYTSDNSDLPSNRVNSIFADNDIIWIGTDEGLLKIENDTWIIYNSNNSDMPINRVIDIDIDSESNLWIATSIGIHGHITKFDGSTWTNYTLDFPDGSAITSMESDNTGNIYVGTYHDGLFKFNGSSWEVLTPDGGPPTYLCVRYLFVDNENIVWIGSGSYYIGFYKFDGSEWIDFSSYNSGLPDNWVTCVTQNNEGFFWIGTEGGGISFFNGIDSQGTNEIINNNTAFSLNQNYPNPFKDETLISYTLNEKAKVKLEIIDLTGTVLSTLVNQWQQTGEYNLNYHCDDLTTGVYFIKLSVNGFPKYKKMIFID